MKVSVIMPTYNQLEFIEDAVESMFKQSFMDYEFIIVNDGSIDGTEEYLKTLTDPRIKVINQQNMGAGLAINEGIKIAKGKYITWISSDNIAPKYFLAGLVAALDANIECKFAYSAYFNIDKDNKIMNIASNNLQITRELLTKNNRGNTSFIYHRDCHDEVGFYSSKASCDTEFWLKLTENYESVYIVEPLYFYRLHDKMATKNKSVEDSLINELNEITTAFMESNLNVNDLMQACFPGMKFKNITSTDASEMFLELGNLFWGAGNYEFAHQFYTFALTNTQSDYLIQCINNLVCSSLKLNLDVIKIINEVLLANVNVNEGNISHYIDLAVILSRTIQLTDQYPIFIVSIKCSAIKRYTGIKTFSYFAYLNQMQENAVERSE